MTPFTTLDSIAIRLDAANIDTDQIIPARFLRHPRKAGYAGFLFHDMRFDGAGDPVASFALNRPGNQGASILVAGDNFGCGSSREGAVYALLDYGIRCVIAPSFGDIFRNNCAKNGVLPIVLGAGEILALVAPTVGQAAPRLHVDLARQEVKSASHVARFEIEPFWKDCLLHGLDDIDLTLRHREKIAAFAAQRFAQHPWLLPPKPGVRSGT
jgi:3-isopropylmalate/(R)-2-methylmalate dehydratase small subunit